MARPAEKHLPRPNAEGRLVELRPASDEALVEALVLGERWAKAQLFDRFAPDLERVLRRLAGRDADLDVEDLLHETFIAAFRSIRTLADPAALPKWLMTIATRTAYRAIRRKRASRWLRFWEPHRLREIEPSDVDAKLLDAYQRTYALLARMPAAERTAFVLRHVERMELTEVAEACGVSLATIKRHLTRARARFERAAAKDGVLRAFLQGGAT